MLTAAIITVHVIVGAGLILLVLLHSGRGGGLTDMFGGLSSAAAGSSVMERNLDRMTVALAVVFGFTTILLALRLQ